MLELAHFVLERAFGFALIAGVVAVAAMTVAERRGVLSPRMARRAFVALLLIAGVEHLYREHLAGPEPQPDSPISATTPGPIDAGIPLEDR